MPTADIFAVDLVSWSLIMGAIIKTPDGIVFSQPPERLGGEIMFHISHIMHLAV